MVDAAGNIPPTNMTVVALPRRKKMDVVGGMEETPDMTLEELEKVITEGMFGIRDDAGGFRKDASLAKKMDVYVIFLILGGCHTWTAYSKLMKVCRFIGACTGISNLTQ